MTQELVWVFLVIAVCALYAPRGRQRTVREGTDASARTAQVPNPRKVQEKEGTETPVPARKPVRPVGGVPPRRTAEAERRFRQAFYDDHLKR